MSSILFNLGKEHLIRIMTELDSEDLRELFARGLRAIDKHGEVLHVIHESQLTSGKRTEEET